MEIVAPAGNRDMLEAVIDAGTNAVYLGLPRWNARLRAANFSREEFGTACRFCHDHGVRVYLTLNTALRDGELTDAVAAFLDLQEYPDAVIVRDVGLARRLRASCPQVRLHFSTQGGCHTLDDLRWLASENIRRAVLARELSAGEIARLAADDTIEVEVFVAGSACFCVSGSCDLGGLWTGGSGDRGRCTGPCRHRYSVGDQQGHWLYARDLDLTDVLATLSAMGVAAVKIEGRRRPADEVANIVRRIRLAEECPAAQDCGRMRSAWFQARRQIALVSRSAEGDAFKRWHRDLCEPVVQEAAGGAPTVAGWQIRAVPPGARFCSLRVSALAEDWLLEFATDDGALLRCRVSATCDSGDASDWATRAVPTPWHCFELQTNGVPLPDASIVRTALSACLPPDPAKDDAPTVPGHRPLLTIEVDNLVNAQAASAADRVLVRVREPEQLDLAWPENVIVRLPQFDWASRGWQQWMERLANRPVMATRWSQVQLLCAQACRWEADSSFDIWNGATLAVARSAGACRITTPRCWSLSESLQFGVRHSVPVEMVLAGAITLGWSRVCWRDSECPGGGCAVALHNNDLERRLRARCGGDSMTELTVGELVRLPGSPAMLPGHASIRFQAAGLDAATITAAIGAWQHISETPKWSAELRQAWTSAGIVSWGPR